jgi:hypothetical protein
LILKQINIGVLRHLLEFLNELLNLLAVKLVIAQNLDNWSIRKALQGPLQAVSAGADVAAKITASAATAGDVKGSNSKCKSLRMWRRMEPLILSNFDAPN